MLQPVNNFLARNRRFIPLSATALLAFAAYFVGAIFLEGMRNPQVFFNLFRNSPFLLISAVGMTFVILTGGIDLSVSGVIALTTVSAAALIRDGWNPWLVFVLMLLMGMTLGATMGGFIAYLKVQPFIATLAGTWFARGMCFFISDDAIAIKHWVYDLIGKTKIMIPGWMEIANSLGTTAPYISIPVVVSLLVLLGGIYLAHFTRFGRTVYAIGGNEGRNEQSARLMGLPVDRTKVLVYTLNGFCSALAGIFFSVFVASGHGLYANGFEMDVIATVVIGGTMLSGGSGYVFGTLFGVLVLNITQTLIQFNGTLSSWWTKIVIGLLTLMFIGVQSLIAGRKGGRKFTRANIAAWARTSRGRRRIAMGAAAAVAVLVLGIIFLPRMSRANDQALAATARCTLQPFRQEVAAGYIQDGAVIAYERNGGANCIDEIYAVYPDGKIIRDDGTDTQENTITPTAVEGLVTNIKDYGWFTDALYDTWHTPCGQCYGYYLTVSDGGTTKTVKAVDGGTDAPSDYWHVISLIKAVTVQFNTP